MLGFPLVLQEARGHHWCEGQGDERGYANAHGGRDRKLAEQPADNAPHQQQRNKHGNQRNADRQDGKSDFAGPLHGRVVGPHPVLDMAHDVLKHHDGIVDHEADRDGEGHQRYVVEAVADQIHEAAGAEQRERNRDAGDDGRPERPQEQEDDGNHEGYGDHEGHLNVLDGRADRLRPVAYDLHAHRWWHGRREMRQLRLDAVDGVDDVGARLLEHHEEYATLALRPGRLLCVLGSGHRPADVAYAQRRAVAVGDDHIVPGVGDNELVVGVNRIAAEFAVDVAFRRVDGRDRKLGAHVFERQVLRDEFRRVDLDANGGLLLAAYRNQANPGDLADLLGNLGIGIVVDVCQ